MDIYQKLILDIIDLNTKQKLNIEDLKTIKRDFAKANKLSDIPTNIKLIRAYQQLVQTSAIEKSIEIENLLKKRAVRSQSGIVAVQVLTKPYMCPGKCIFCPNEEGMPKSYISTEPGAMRALLNQFDPIKQTYNRLLSLTMTGHQTDKIEMIVLGGTRDVYPQEYKLEFIKSLYDACNNFSKLKFDLPEDTLLSEFKSPLTPLGKRGEYQHLSVRGKMGFFDFQKNISYTTKNNLITRGSLPYHVDAKKKAISIRKNQTEAEKKIWNSFLKDLDANVYRQKPIDHFVADFYIPSSKLIIEIDGDIHENIEQSEHDVWRDELLAMYGIAIVRIKNKDIENNFDGVKEELANLIEYTKSLKDQLKTDINTSSFSKRGKGGDLTKQKSRYSYNIKNLDEIIYSSSLQEAIKINETADNRIIGLTIETRPEYMTDANCQLWREMGVTRLEMGVQSMYDDVLDANKRGHSVQTIRNAIHKMRQYGFKFSIHIMPGLYKSNYDKDLGTFYKIYSDPFIKPDEIKFYPTSVIPNTELYDLYKKGEYSPLDTDTIQKLIKKTFQEIIPPYTRIKRLIRDIPATEIAAGSNVTNLSQLTHNSLKKEFKSNPDKAQKLYSRLYGDYKLFKSIGEFSKYILSQTTDNHEIKIYIIGQNPDIRTYREFVALDTRSREIRNKPKSHKSQDQKPNLIVRQYSSSVGIEYFISFEDLQGYLYGFARLLLPQKGNTVDREGLGQDTALIRELHVYGQLASLKSDIASDSNADKSSTRKQHKGFGTQLMNLAEELSQNNGFKRLSVISGVGVRGYYEKIGYSLEGTYMVKKL